MNRDTVKVVREPDGRTISAYAWYFRWRRQQRFARRCPEKAAVLAAERIIASW